MQYSSDKKQKNTGFYIMVALCLVAVFVASYLAVTKNVETRSEKNTDIVNNQPNESYTVNKSEDNIIDDNKNSTETKTENETPKSEPYAAKQPKQTFVIPVKGKIIKQFSNTSLQYDKTFGDMRIHKGTDIACKKNDKIVSATSGTVLDVIDTANFSTVVTIDHGNGFIAKYCGLGSVSVKKGDSVNTGDQIGTATNPPCECMDECHIHIECLKDGVDFDPISLYNEKLKSN